VADFVGAERGLKALQVRTVDEAELVPGSATTTVPATATLAEALSALLLTEDGCVGVAGASGVLTLEAVHRAARTGAG
jgi:succinyl-CoA synthetase alpha subunit